MYPDSIVEGHRGAVTGLGAESLEDVDRVDDALSSGRCVVVVNSVCGCAAETLIPALEGASLDESLDWYTVFAGVDDEATEAARSYFEGFGPSSPAVVFLEDGEVDTYLGRGDVMRCSADEFGGHVEDAADRLRSSS